ncbi:TPA: hypothetical protein NKU35_000367 [Vibrio parahaemolyticus]|uniref:hypothetical protein n=1 Tax=Vibrio parahaemolyticus TaxID=670 RepID=UPI0024AF6160|nr:hypothetical protein [Vibrio parahaemolyticus]MDI7833651.1 hypothetical protein [Vibrio parahaemolyticus]HCE2846241.1 hypothetical protein [Vibrio parahaemolyticus]HCE2862156.1 hypothetical protein [Vibrio parahaemolyticus]HCE2877368.1 hypothetical protein [Vibrio parahaemolyticus]HCH3133472.1 hypothetical protein [Vibrio parahaemolyticus]
MSLEDPLVGIFDENIQVNLANLTINIHDSELLSTYISRIKDELIIQRRDLRRSAIALEEAFNNHREILKKEHSGQEPFRFVFTVYFEDNLPSFQWFKVIVFNRDKPPKLEMLTGNILKQKRMSNVADWERQMYYHLCLQIEEMKVRADFISDFEKKLLQILSPIDKIEMFIQNKVN